MREAADALQRAGDLLLRRCLPEAIEAFNRAEQLGASHGECAGGRWLGCMLMGHFEAAWQESDRLRQEDSPDPHRFWQGESLHGKRVIVRCLHGLGDSLQMMGYAAHLEQVAASVTWEVPPRFLPLARIMPGVDQAITWGDRAPIPAPVWDVQVECMELPYLFRTSLADLPSPPGVQLPDHVVAEIAALMGGRLKPRVGVVWAAGEWNPSRSISPALLQPLLEEDRFEFWSLQGGPAALDGAASPMRDASATCGSGLVVLAATIANLDLVITVDTLAAHLAGALGKPVWLMLQFAADWRWLMDRDDSPWYPSLRIFRQRESGVWEQVVADIRKALQHYTAAG